MKGQCFCAAVRYELTELPQSGYVCHCRDCQYLAGAPYHALAAIPRKTLRRLKGETSLFRHPTQDGSEMTREFCGQCGTPLFLNSSRWDDITMLVVTTLDDPQAIPPAFEVWTRSRLSWAQSPLHVDSYLFGSLDGDVEPRPGELS